MVSEDAWALFAAISIGTGTAFLVLVICVVIEHIATIERFTLRQRLPGAMMALAGGILAPLVSWPLNKLWLSFDLGKQVVIPLAEWLAPFGVAGAIVQVVFAALLADFLRYWRHRAEHRLFWPIHAVHHAPRELHAANSLGHPLQAVPDFIFVTIPLSLISFGVIYVPVAVSLILSFLAVYIHSPIDFHFGPLRRIVVDNRFHRIHHSIEERHFERNFGIAFSIWDAVFRTAHFPAKDEWPKVGVEGLRPPGTLADFLAMPFRLIARSDEERPKEMPEQV